MGNAFSKTAARKLPKHGNVISAVNIPGNQQQPRPSATNEPLNGQPSKADIGRDGFDPDFDSKLRQLGMAQFKEIPQKYVKTNHMLSAVEARNSLDQKLEEELKDPKIPRTQLHPSTLFALLESRKDGDSNDDLTKHYNLDRGFLNRLGTRASIPDKPSSKRLRQIQNEKEAEMLKAI